MRAVFRGPRLDSDRGVALTLAGLVAVSIVLRLLLVSIVEAPTVFNDELGYMKLAQSIGLDGRMALLDHEGLSYSPLYSVVLAPFYALGASAPTVYALAHVTNAILISLAVLPLYAIARFVLPRRESVLVAALSVVAPLMSYASFTMSENLAYPLTLVALWAMVASMRRPGLRGDVLLIAAILVATVGRVQLIVLWPAAVTAAMLMAIAVPERGFLRRLRRAVIDHWLLLGVTAAALLIAGIRALAGGDVYSAFGRYAVVGRLGLPNAGEVLELFVHHLAGLDLAVGVVPFVAALVAAFAFVRAGLPRRQLPFAAVATSFTAWLLLEVAVDAAQFDSPGGDVPRIHERFMVYAIPLFFVALLAAVRMQPSRASGRVYLVAGAIAALLPALIPFGTYVNTTTAVDTFALVPFGHGTRTGTEAVRFATVVAVWIAATLAWLYARMVRHKPRGVVLLLSIVFVYMSGFVWVKHHSGSSFGRSQLPAQADWVDSAGLDDGVALIADADNVPALETTYFNISIARVYTLCRITFGPDFGEEQVTLDGTVRLRQTGEPIDAPYAVVPTRLGVEGEVLARNPQGGQVLVASPGGRLVLGPEEPEHGCAQRPRPASAP
jgi:hypothetical protein